MLLFPYQGYSQSFTSEINEIIRSDGSQGAFYGISIIDENGQQVFGHNEESMFIPASTLKLITTFSTLLSLGLDYQYETKVGYTGNILKDGTLHGDLVIRGSGDPSLGSPSLDGGPTMEEVFSAISEYVFQAGITCIDGRLIIDASIFDQKAIHPSWPWDDMTNYYASGAYGVNIHENLYRLGFKRKNAPFSSTEIVEIEPFIPELNFSKNGVTTGSQGSGDNAYIYGDPYSNERWTEGTIPPGASLFFIKGAIPSPSSTFAYHLMYRLKQMNIVVNDFEVETTKSRSMDELIGSISSQPLHHLVKHANAVSNNMFCEAFLKSVGARANEHPASFETSLKYIEGILESQKIETKGWKQVDGSGLSPRNRLSPSFMTSFLYRMKEEFGLAKMKEMIPQTGVEGSVRRFLNDSPAQRKSWLKSGSINHVLCYSGVLKADNEKHYFITIMANGHQSNRKIREQVGAMVTSFYKNL